MSSLHFSLNLVAASFLSSLWALNPKVIVMMEQDSEHNGKSLMERLSESLYFYADLFDCLESALPRASLERLKMEKMLLGQRNCFQAVTVMDIRLRKFQENSSVVICWQDQSLFSVSAWRFRT